MSTIEPWYDINAINFRKLSKKENKILDLELFLALCDELKEIFRTQYKNYFTTMKFTREKENTMLDENILNYIIKDIISTEEYSVAGIARYTYVPEDAIYDLITGKNTNPSLFLARKLIGLHRSVKPQLYRELLKKVLSQVGGVELT